MLSHDIVIVGGGAAGISVAALFLRRGPRLDRHPPIYWDAMLNGHEWLAAPKPIQDAGR